MLVTIIHSENMESSAKSLRADVKAKWSDVNVNLMGTRRILYQVQLESKVVYSADSVTDNNSIIDLIEERL
jgi:hypothetical protein